MEAMKREKAAHAEDKRRRNEAHITSAAHGAESIKSANEQVLRPTPRCDFSLWK